LFDENFHSRKLVGFLQFADMPMVALAGLVVVTKNAPAAFDESQPVLEGVF